MIAHYTATLLEMFPLHVNKARSYEQN